MPFHLIFLVVASEKEKHHLESEENVKNWLLKQPPNSEKEDIKMPKGKSKIKKKVTIY